MAMMLRNSAGATLSYNTIEEIGAAILERQEVPLRQDGTAMTLTPFLGGLLFDGYPLNVLLFGVWYPGQQEALVDAGWSIPDAARSLPVVEPTTQAAGGYDVKKLVLYGAVGFLLYNAFRK